MPIRDDLRQQILERIKESQPINFIEDPTKLRRVDFFPQQERSTTHPLRDLQDFYKLFEAILNVAAEEDGLEYKIPIKGSHPDESSHLPCITTEVVMQEPFSAMGKAKKEYSPRLMDTIPDPEQPGSSISIFMRREEQLVRLTCWAKTGKERGRLADWVKEKFYQYLWGIQWGGMAHPILFEKREGDYTEKVANQRIFAAPLVFSVRTAKTIYRRETNLRRIFTEIGVWFPE